MRAIRTELKDARTELLRARLGLQEVSDRLGAGASAHGTTGGGNRVTRRHRRLLLLGGRGGGLERRGGGESSSTRAEGDVS
jgi:hypothetical protein